MNLKVNMRRISEFIKQKISQEFKVRTKMASNP